MLSAILRETRKWRSYVVNRLPVSVFDFMTAAEIADVKAGTALLDHTAALNTAAAAGIRIYLPAGIYTTTTGVTFIHGTKFQGEGMYSVQASTHSTDGVCTIKYTGSGGTNSFIVSVSDEAVGTEPTVAADRDMQNCALTNIDLDGDETAEFGLYGVRCLWGNPFDFISVRRTLKHAFWIAACFGGNPRSWHAFKNNGNGITIGRNTFGWANSIVDTVVFTNILALRSGYSDASETYQNTFDDAVDSGTTTSTTSDKLVQTGQNFTSTVTVGMTVFNSTDNTFADVTAIDSDTILSLDSDIMASGENFTIYDQRQEYGIGFFGGRATTFIGADAELCGGPGIYTETTQGPVTFIDTYVEGNCASSGASSAWDIWFHGAAGAVSREVLFDGVHIGLNGDIKLSGVPTAREEAGVEFRRTRGLTNVNNDWAATKGNYRFINNNQETTFTGAEPNGFLQASNLRAKAGNASGCDGLNLGVVGALVFNVSGAAIDWQEANGIVGSVAYTATGIYTVTLSTGAVFSSAKYGIIVSGATDRTVGTTSITTTTFVIENRNAGNLSDSGARISCLLTGYYI